MADKPLLEVKDLVIHYKTDDGVVKALNGVIQQDSHVIHLQLLVPMD